MISKRSCITKIAILIILTNSVGGEFVMPSLVPIERLIANAQQYSKEYPNDPFGYYTLGRLHYLAFAERASMVPALPGFDEKGCRKVLPRIERPFRAKDTPEYAQGNEAIRRALEEFGVVSTYDLTGQNARTFWDRVSTIQDELKATGWQPKTHPLDELLRHVALAQWNFNRTFMLNP